MRPAAQLTATLLVAATACYHPNPEVGQPCSPLGDCPSGQHCDQMLSPPTCVVVDPAGDAGPDATIDAPVVACATGSGCPSDEPVCDPMSGLCRGCRADAECATVACEESTGLCIASDEVVYVAAAGAGSACTMTAPCATIAQGIETATTGRTFVAIAAGTYDEEVQIAGGSVAVLSGPGSGAVATIAGPIIVNGDAGPYLIESLSASTPGTCVQLETPASVKLFGDIIGPCAGDGVDVQQGATTIRRTEIIGGGSGAGTGVNQMGGPNGSAIALDVEQTAIGAFATGIQTQGGTFIIRNDLLAENVSLGIHVHNQGGTTTSVVDFVTIVDGGRAISCSGIDGAPSLAITSSLFAENQTAPSIDTSCPVSYSVWDDTSTPQGSNNGSGETPVFVDPNTGDYHLAAGSPGINAADPSSTTTVDIEGAPRPSGGGFDCGAFQGQ